MTTERAELVERLGEALFILSDKLRANGSLADDGFAAAYENVVAAFQALSTLTNLGDEGLAREAADNNNEAVQRFAIRVEKLLCSKLGIDWTPAGISIESLADRLATPPIPVGEARELVARAREALRPFAACAEHYDMTKRDNPADFDDRCQVEEMFSIGQFRAARAIQRALDQRSHEGKG